MQELKGRADRESCRGALASEAALDGMSVEELSAGGPDCRRSGDESPRVL
ncbi:MAG: hypothetical protein OXN84_01070 [Albidovulum sp.]|nr:hypothetical protein [Albidovulum sp.]